MSVKIDINDLEKTVQDCNKFAIEALQECNYSTAFELLSKAKQHLTHKAKCEQVFRLKAITYNNFGCFYRRQQQLPRALQFLMQALSYENRLNSDNTNVAGTFLNISSIHSELGDHTQALTYALNSIKSIEGNFKSSLNSATTLIIAYKTAGNEHNFLGKRRDAQSFYVQGYELAVQFLGNNHELTKALAELCKPVNTKEKQNPVIDRMLNYFKKHIGKRNFSLENHSVDQRKLDRKSIKIKKAGNEVQNNSSHKHERLQPITNMKTSQFGDKTKQLSASLVKKNNNSSTPYMKKHYFNIGNRAINKKVNSIKDKIVYFQKKLSMFEENDASMKKMPIVQRSNNKIDKKNKNQKQKIILIQKHIRGWLARKRIKKLKEASVKIQIAFRNHIKRKKLYIRELEPNAFSQQFNPCILRYEINRHKHLKSQTVQTIPKYIKPPKPKKSFLEKIIFLQRFIRSYLKKIKSG